VVNVDRMTSAANLSIFNKVCILFLVISSCLHTPAFLLIA